MSDEWRNQLYFGDNLEVLREHMPDESVDLIYLDPPFNSKATYNVLFKEVEGTPSAAQIQAFDDFWHWDEIAIRTYHELIESKDASADLANLLQGFERFLGHNDMLAYLVMMAPRLVELKRVLKPTGSIYMHCDPTAGHYLKILMDAVFRVKNFRTNIVWKRSSAHSDTKQGRQQHGRIQDIILFYTKSDKWIWNPQYLPYDQDYIDNFYKYVEEGTGRKYRLGDITGPGGAAKGNPHYELMGVTRYWRYSKEKMEELVKKGRIVQTKPGAVPAYKRYLDEMPGVPLQDIWTDINPIASQAKERLGYPTQKPQALLERIITASSNEDDVVLDPFCGCGTTIAAAQALGRRWIGIDITYLAINLIKNRLADHFGEDVTYEIHGIPKDWESARELAEATDRPRKEFELWALSLVKARPKGDPTRKGGPDRGIDGVRFFWDGKTSKDLKPHRVIVQVKSDADPKVHYVRDLRGTMGREGADMGALILLYEPGSRSTIRQEAWEAEFYRSEFDHKDYPRLQVLTVRGLLDGEERLEIPQAVPDDLTHKRARKITKQGRKGKQKGMEI